MGAQYQAKLNGKDVPARILDHFYAICCTFGWRFASFAFRSSAVDRWSFNDGSAWNSTVALRTATINSM